MKTYKHIQFISTLFFIFYLPNPIKCQQNTDSIKNYFEEYKQVCNSENGQIWSYSLNTPLMLIDPITKRIIANQTDEEGYLKYSKGIYIGLYDGESSNTTIDWKGKKWGMVSHIPKDRKKRLNLLSHECFHSIQQKLGLNHHRTKCSHLSRLDDKFWLFMEYSALYYALNYKDKRKNYLKDALIFRKKRHSLSKRAFYEENEFEKLEGTANYTGYKFSGSTFSEIKQLLQNKNKSLLEDGMKDISHNFAYYSGLYYGYLFDLSGIDWKNSEYLKFDFGMILQKLYQIKLKNNEINKAKDLTTKYNGIEIYNLLESKYTQISDRKKLYKQLFFVDHPYTLKIKNKSITFNNTSIQEPIDSVGTVYNNLILTTEKYRIQIDTIVFVNNNWSEIRLLPDSIHVINNTMKGVNWEIKKRTKKIN
jgi:hypothetical protein